MDTEDSLLIDSDGDMLQQFVECVAEIGGEYGLTFNVAELEALPMRWNDVVQNGLEQPAPNKEANT